MTMTGFVPSAPRARRTDPQTSLDAGDAASDFAREHVLAIAETLLLHGPQNIHEIAQHTGLKPEQVARRLPEEPTLFKTIAELRRSPAGRNCRVWSHV